MKITAPCIITSRLLPGLALNGGTISIEYAHGTNDGRMAYLYHFDLGGPDHYSFSNDDLSSGVGSWALQEGLGALLSFLAAACESRQYDEQQGTEPDEPYGFPVEVLDFYDANQSDLEYIQMELEEGKAIEE